MKQSRRPTLELICGPSCMGKTTFTKNIDSKYCFEKLHVSIEDQVYNDIHKIAHMSSRAFKHLTRDQLDWIYEYCVNLTLFLSYRIKAPPKWDHRWDVIKTHPIKKRAIILCTSESEWHRRLKKREPLKGESLGGFIKHFKDTYIKWMEELDRYNVPYIFINNNIDILSRGLSREMIRKENNYPVIHKSDFLKMLDES